MIIPRGQGLRGIFCFKGFNFQKNRHFIRNPRPKTFLQAGYNTNAPGFYQ